MAARGDPIRHGRVRRTLGTGALNATNFITNTTDGAQVNATLVSVPGATITDPGDFNRDKGVTTTDGAIINANLGKLNRLLVGSAGPFAPEGGGGDGDSSGDAGTSAALAGGGGGGSASATTQALPTVALPRAVVERLDSDGSGTSAAVDAALAGGEAAARPEAPARQSTRHWPAGRAAARPEAPARRSTRHWPAVHSIPTTSSPTPASQPKTSPP